MKRMSSIAPPRSGAWNVLTGPNGSGKSRYLGDLAEKVIDQFFASGKREYSNLICLSGTVFERYPRAAYEADAGELLIYLGHKTNHNMFSAISPFRNLVRHMLQSSDRFPQRCIAASSFLKGLGFEGQMRIKLRQGRNAKDKLATPTPTEVDINFTHHSPKEAASWIGVAEKLNSAAMHVADVQFIKSGGELSLADLSSGERAYILSGLAFCFCAINGSLILFDEPENSLHPEWQSRIVVDLDHILNSLGVAATVVVATHSPLIAASVPNQSGYICDLLTDQPWSRMALFGMNTDNVLAEQFGLRSARSAQAVDVIQECLTLIANAQQDSDEFRSAGDEFIKLDLRLTKDDPLFRTVQTIKELIEAAN